MTTPPPHHAISYRKASTKNAPSFKGDAHRKHTGRAFNKGADTYHDVRPGYPSKVLRLIEAAGSVVDIGAGTGKLTERLAAANRQVYALDPSAAMTRFIHENLKVPVWQASAEATGMATDSVDAITCAQTWHWVDVEAAGREWDRILRPEGSALLVWNTLDTRDPWTLRLARIMHSGDIQPPGFVPEIPNGWSIVKEQRSTWNDHVSPQEIHALTHTRSYWLRASEKIRQRVTENLDWYLFEHTGLQTDSVVALGYRTDAFLMQRD